MKKRMRDRVLDFFFPPKCVFCRQLLLPDEAGICTQCRLILPLDSEKARQGTFFSGFTAVFDYDGIVRESLHRYKFGAMEQYAQCYGKLLAASVSAKLAGPFDLVTWTPVSAKRLRKRGYDQSRLLAAVVADAVGSPCVRALTKTRDNPAQSGLGGAQSRRANVLGVYAAVNAAALAGKRILLIDDIATTGATLEEASRILLTAGAAEVHCAVLASQRKSNG